MLIQNYLYFQVVTELLTAYQFTNNTHLSFHLIFLFKLYRFGDLDLVVRSSNILRFIITEFLLNYSLLM